LGAARGWWGRSVRDLYLGILIRFTFIRYPVRSP
jgi:hypothetical protein